MLLYHGSCVGETGGERSIDLLIKGTVAQSHGDIATPSLIAGSSDSRAFSSTQKLRLVPAEQGKQRTGVEAIAGIEVCNSADLSKLIPGTEQLAVITAKDAIPHGCSKFNGNATSMLYRQVSDAASGIQLIGCDDGGRRADIQAPSTGTTVVAGSRFI